VKQEPVQQVKQEPVQQVKQEPVQQVKPEPEPAPIQQIKENKAEIQQLHNEEELEIMKKNQAAKLKERFQYIANLTRGAYLYTADPSDVKQAETELLQIMSDWQPLDDPAFKDAMKDYTGNILPTFLKYDNAFGKRGTAPSVDAPYTTSLHNEFATKARDSYYYEIHDEMAKWYSDPNMDQEVKKYTRRVDDYNAIIHQTLEEIQNINPGYLQRVFRHRMWTDLMNATRSGELTIDHIRDVKDEVKGYLQMLQDKHKIGQKVKKKVEEEGQKVEEEGQKVKKKEGKKKKQKTGK